MRRFFFLIFLLAGMVHTLFAQDVEKLKKYQSPVSQRIYSKGDTILVGDMAKNVFSSAKKYAAIFVKDKKNVCGYRELDSVIAGTPCVIRNILSFKEHCTFEFKNAVVFELQGPDNRTLFMPVDKALQVKEVIVFPNPIKNAGIEILDERTVFLLNLEQAKGISADYALKYCKLIDPEKGRAYNQNPALFEKEKKEWIQKLDAARKITRIKDTFLIALPVYLSKFSFDKGEFQVVDDPLIYGSKALKVTTDSKLLFDNYKSFTSIRSTKDNADFFLNVTTSDYNGNRKAYAQIKAICTTITKEPVPGGATAENPGSNILHFTILEMIILDSDNPDYNYIGSRKLK
ncbi:DUF4852 domain-containing protein [Fluviicola sp.]|jgi:hypothetical protein|uniref:DUF4852 domain-containing protein n=1 Tax=Fluviicola sp. TaxID=1917219 RepID=UPI002829256B|nr:DUF4852 domain-containing protein [Fluviicola sp.]MDR0801706.1 DUF4852 domain-containing protein [Fluviicola sp.]